MQVPTITAAQVRKQASTEFRSGFSQLHGALLEPRPCLSFPWRSTTTRNSFCHAESLSAAHSLSVWMLSPHQTIYPSILPEQVFFFFSGQIHHFLEYFYIIAAELIWWHTANMGFRVYILLQPAMTLDRGLLRCMHFKSLHITLESVKWSSNKRVKFSSRDLSAYCCFDERGNSNIILIALASSHAWGLSCRPKWALTPR